MGSSDTSALYRWSLPPWVGGQRHWGTATEVPQDSVLQIAKVLGMAVIFCCCSSSTVGLNCLLLAKDIQALLACGCYPFSVSGKISAFLQWLGWPWGFREFTILQTFVFRMRTISSFCSRSKEPLPCNLTFQNLIVFELQGTG